MNDSLEKRNPHRRALRIATAINAVMFLVETLGAVRIGSISLMADGIDMLEDALTYGFTLVVLGMSLRTRATAGLAKGVAMALPGIWIVVQVVRQLISPVPPAPLSMSVVGVMALIANVTAAFVLMGLRKEESNIRSVWLSARNDVFANIAIIAAGLGVLVTAAAWPDLLVGVGIAAMNLLTAFSVIRQATGELRAAGVTG